MPPCEASSGGASILEIDEAVSSQQVNSEDVVNAVSQHSKEEDPVVKWLYIYLCFLCYSMVVWIWISPSSLLLHRTSFHRTVVLPFLHQMDAFRVVPEHVLTKYDVHPLVQLLHVAPASVWAAIIPFQLHSTWRTQHARLHRILGYLFLATVLPISAGLLLIVERKLALGHSFPDLPPQALYSDSGHPVMLSVLALWFSGTALYAVQLARQKQYQRHRRWMIRHVATGIFVAVQRFLLIPILSVLYEIWYVPNKFQSEPISPWAQREIFGLAATLSLVLSQSLGELAISRIQNVQPVIKKAMKMD